MYHPSILHRLNQTYPSDNESTADDVGGTGQMTFNSIAQGMLLMFFLIGCLDLSAMPDILF